MSIRGVVKAGWFLVGFSIGVLGTTIIFKRELDKPIGEIEEYIPLEDRETDISENGDTIASNRETGRNNKSNGSVRKKDRSSDQKDISTRRNSGERTDNRGRRSSRHNDREENHIEFASNSNEVLDYYKSSSEDDVETPATREHIRRREFENSRSESKQGTKYSRMYKEQAVEKVLHDENSHRSSRNSYEIDFEDECDIYDSPDDDDYVISQVYDEDIHDEYTLERVEENIEIFLDDNPQDFVTLIFYEGDNTLCDDGEQIVPHAEEVVGLVALSRLIEGGPGAENGVIFVHNLKTSLNYEVVLDAGSYQDTVIGRFESHLNGDGDWDGSS